MNSLLAGVFGVDLVIVPVRIAVGPQLMLRERRRRAGGHAGPGGRA